jgi:hypothetical protein
MLAPRDAPSGPGFGLFCAIAAIGMAAQTYITYRKGYVYSGRTQVVHRKDGLWKFRIWLCVHILFVIFLVAASIYGFLT